jgi:hypothetical protein
VKRGSIERSEERTEPRQQNRVKRGSIERSEERTEPRQQNRVKRGSIERSEERTEPRQQNRVKRGSIERSDEWSGSRPGSSRPARSPGSYRPGANAKRRLPLAVVLGLMLVGGLCALLALNTASAALEVRNRTITDDNANSSDTEQQLLRDLAARQAPGALASAAAALGMVPNQNPAFLKINADGSVSVLGSPAPAVAPAIPMMTPKPKPKPTATQHLAAPTATTTGKPSATATTRPGARPTTTPSATATTRPSTRSPGGH